MKSFILDVLCPLITESDSVSNELLDIVLSNLVEPQKSSRKNAYYIAKEVLIKTADTLKTYTQAVSFLLHLPLSILLMISLFSSATKSCCPRKWTRTTRSLQRSTN